MRESATIPPCDLSPTIWVLTGASANEQVRGVFHSDELTAEILRRMFAAVGQNYCTNATDNVSSGRTELLIEIDL